MKAIEWRPRAETDAADAALWYARQGGLALGQRFLAELEATLQRIAMFPASGSVRHADLAAQLPALLRFMQVPGFERYLVYYLDLPDRVDVMRVWCVDRGLDALMQDIS
ncbi:type II toxin-antitoxin system RelE/ParE family toxin [Stenotrophomonas maltophilia]|uniref:Plasmid stabilization system n=1 Tax=Stenotrophomonas maltophilia (strain R551-3) TaxID=391008 RepID=B4SS93_STRM5|nr:MULTISPECIES: type II toxin-antitoxin system RelE/ParE family toxin [Stenotrophomonas]ACF52725.1 plasmid stabilization system [Stenotrophomonas maltophilia R551-3]EKU9958190.1 type II toxin-antitoxin system RelE/ParE family toxin [Stenotrophomonas maltophilia]EKU9986077.1 type II toxin-antitoxin system RelE/ParE family toxin [Stenotrophomonas maltophilia]KGM24860.1 plasmid stabilization protein [Stenotrophomonas maltophilia]MBA0354371.1 type II toxin-antitoxin system RelE/ParE family toxin 